MKDLSIIVPLLNEEESLRELYQRVSEVCQKHQIQFEMIFINDGSTDGSQQVLNELYQQFPEQIALIVFRKNYGKAAALSAGFEQAKGRYVMTMDADLQDDPEEIPLLIEKLEEGYDLVSGWKFKRYDPLDKTLPSKIFNKTVSLLSGIKLHDFNCGLKMYRCEVVKSVDLYGELHRFIPVLAHWKGFSVTEKPVQHHPRKFGKSKYGLRRFFSGFFDLLTVILTTRFLKTPLHFFGFLGLGLGGVGVLINLYFVILKMMGLGISRQMPLLLAGILLTMLGIQFFCTGLLAEMLSAFSRRKEYVIKENKKRKDTNE